MLKEVKNIGTDVRAPLQNLSRETGQSFDLILTRCALERLLYRLSASVYAERFVLKRAMLLASWFENPHRATRNLDLFGFGVPDQEAMIAVFREILVADVADGVEFDLDALRVDQIREELKHGGLRLRTTASISGARIAVTVDVGFGDALEPGAEVIEHPSIQRSSDRLSRLIQRRSQDYQSSLPGRTARNGAAAPLFFYSPQPSGRRSSMSTKSPANIAIVPTTRGPIFRRWTAPKDSNSIKSW